jgi:tRNA(Ile)-lysidine synthase
MICNFDDHFKKLLKSFNSNNKFVLGLSGGVDSMALLHLIKNFRDDERNVSVNCIPIIVDHNLRDESERESKEVKKISENLGFDTQIKKIDSCKPEGNIQNWARKERRNILFEKCLELSANLILGHHFDDQVETLFMRMTKESALDGLSGMKEITLWNGIFIIRPLLNYKKKQIKNYVRNKKIYYFEDSSNINTKFERVKTRFYLDYIKKNIWPNITNDINYFSDLNYSLLKKTDYFFKNWSNKHIMIHEGGAVRVDYESLKNVFDKSFILAVRIVGKIIQTVGGKEYAPKRKKTLELLFSMFKKTLKKKSLGNVNIFFNRGYLFFIRENRNLNFGFKIQQNKYYIFDGRFLVKSSLAGKLVKYNNSELSVIDVKNPFYEYCHWINNTIPYLETLEGETIKPHLSIINQNPILDNKENCFSLYLLNRILV